MITTGAPTVNIRPAKAAYLSGSGNVLTLALGPIEGGSPPYQVDFSHVSTFGSRSRAEEIQHGHLFEALASVSFSGAGIPEGGYAYASAKISAGQAEGSMLYFPPGSYISVSDTAGNKITARLSDAGFQILNIPWEE